MKKRWGVTAWLLGAVALVIVAGVALDALRMMFPSKEELEQAARGPQAPLFKEGDVAPDFSLPDHTGKQRRLSELVRGDTLLFFTCGCGNCQEVQNYVSILRKKMGAKAPQVVNVTTMKPEGEESWVERTELPQTILYEGKDGPVMKQYRGHPCPRVYRLKPDRTVAWIGPSPAPGTSIQIVGVAVARNLGFKSVIPGTNRPVDGGFGFPDVGDKPAAQKTPGAQKSTHGGGLPHAAHSAG